MLFFKGIRWYNLLIVWVLNLLLWIKLSPYIRLDFFVLLVLTELFIMAGGNLENDLTDVRTDKINRKKNYYHRKDISFRKYYPYFFYLIGLITGLILGFKTGEPKMVLYFSGIIILLVNYNFVLKKTPVFGNVLIAFLITLTIINFIVFFSLPKPVVIKLILMSLLAFWANLNRELLKDLSDRRGDRLSGYMTLGVISPSLTLQIAFVNHILLFLLIMFSFFQIKYSLLSFITWVLIMVMSIYMFRFYFNADRWKKLIDFYKLMMIGGIFLYFFSL